MREELIIIGAALGILAVAGLVLASAVFLTAQSHVEQPQVTSTTSIPTTSTTALSETTTTTSTSLILEPTSTTMQALKRLALEFSPKRVYKGDELRVVVKSGESPIPDAMVTLDAGNPQNTDTSGVIDILKMDDGNHTIHAFKEGYDPVNGTVSVDPLPYLLSSAVKTQRTPEERQELILSGKVVFRFYDTPNCPNCLRMKPWAGAIANVNRECVKYELLILIHDGPRNEIKEMFPDQSNVVTPVLVIDGPAGHYVFKGFLPKSQMENMIKSSSDGRCPIE